MRGSCEKCKQRGKKTTLAYAPVIVEEVQSILDEFSISVQYVGLLRATCRRLVQVSVALCEAREGDYLCLYNTQDCCFAGCLPN